MKGTYKFAIEHWLPTSVNQLLKSHWAQQSAMKKRDAEMIAAYFIRSGAQKATGPRKLDVTFTSSRRGRKPDADNLLKSTLDGLVRCGAILDDGPSQLQLGDVRVQHGPSNRVEITLTDLT